MTLSSSVTDWMKRSIPRFSSVDPGSPSRSAFCEEDVGEKDVSLRRHLGHLVAAQVERLAQRGDRQPAEAERAPSLYV